MRFIEAGCFFASLDSLLTGQLLHGDQIHGADSWVLYWFPIAAYGLQNRNNYSSGSQKSLNQGARRLFLETPEESPHFRSSPASTHSLHALAHGPSSSSEAAVPHLPSQFLIHRDIFSDSDPTASFFL